MNQPLRIGILGCARIVRRAVIGALGRARGVVLQGIASRRRETARQWAAEFNIPRFYDSYEALIAADEIDAIYNPLPNELHHPWTLRAAAAGKHVLCEKPLALDDSQADEIVAGCRRHGVVLMEAFMWRHHPRVGRALDMLRGGQIGELRLIKVDFSFPIDRSDWRLDPARGGGALFDIGCYGINAARLFTGSEPVEISAHAQMAESGVDMTIGMLLRFAGGELGLVDASFEAPDRNRLELVGTRASIEFPGGFLPSAETTLVIRRDRELEIMPFAGADQYAAQFEAFGESVRTGRLCYPAEDGLANMKALDQVRRIAWRHC